MHQFEYETIMKAEMPPRTSENLKFWNSTVMKRSASALFEIHPITFINGQRIGKLAQTTWHKSTEILGKTPMNHVTFIELVISRNEANNSNPGICNAARADERTAIVQAER